MNKKISQITLLIILILTALSVFQLRHLRFEFDIEKFFPANDPDRAFYEEFEERFHAQSEDDYIFIGLQSKSGIFNRQFLEKADSLTKFIKKLDNIIAAYSLTNLSYFYFVNGNLSQSPFVHISQPELYKNDSLILFRSSEVRKTQVSKDGRSIVIAAFNAKDLSSADKNEIMNSVNRKIEELKFDKTYIAAKIRVERTYITETERNLKIYLLLSFLIIAGTLFLLYRTLRDIWLPFAVILISLCWTLAIVTLFDYPLDIISSLLPPILAIVCMSDIIHITIRYKEELKAGHSKELALSRTFNEVGPAIFFTSLTTAVGFFSLCITNIIPIKMFGMFAGIGVMLEFFVTMGFMWSVNFLTNPPSPKSIKTVGWHHFLSGCLLLMLKFKKGVFLITSVLVIISVFLISKIEINRSLLQEIPTNNPILKDYKFFESQFAGTRPFEVQFSAFDSTSSFYSINTLRALNEIANFAEDSLKVGLIFSPLVFLKGANKVFKGGGQAAYALPDNQQEADYCFRYIMMSPYGGEMMRFITEDGRQVRLSGKLPDLNSKDYKRISDKFKRYFNSHIPAFQFTYRETGSSLLFDKVSYSLIKNMFQGIAIGFGLISLIAYFMFRSVKMSVIVLISNVVPLVVLGGLMGLLGIWLKEDTSIIFSIALGLAVDNTIHFISRFRLEMEKGNNVLYSVKRTYLGIGKAMSITTLVLFAGFMTLLFSSFGGTFYVGLLVSFCLVLSLIANLTITPLLILQFYRKQKNLPKSRLI